MSRIAVIMPVYNTNKNYVEKAITSFVGQSLGGHSATLYVVNDGSTNGICEYLQSIDIQDVSLVNLDANMGISAARNAGIEGAIQNSDDYITFLDADDMLTEESLALRADYLDDHKSNLVFGKTEYVCPEGNLYECRPKGPVIQEEWIDSFWRDLRMRVHLNSGMYSASSLAGLRFDPQFARSEDKDFLYQLLTTTDAGFIDEVVYKYQIGAHDLIRTLKNRLVSFNGDTRCIIKHKAQPSINIPLNAAFQLGKFVFEALGYKQK